MTIGHVGRRSLLGDYFDHRIVTIDREARNTYVTAGIPNERRAATAAATPTSSKTRRLFSYLIGSITLPTTAEWM